MGTKLPIKLETDSILEAVLEIRFEPDLPVVPEILVGRFADAGEWREFRQARLPAADISARSRLSVASRHEPERQRTHWRFAPKGHRWSRSLGDRE